MITSIRPYHSGQPRPELTSVEQTTRPEPTAPPHDFVWVSVVDPTPVDIATLREHLGMPAPPDDRPHHVRPLIVQDGGWVFVSVWIPDASGTITVDVFVGATAVVTLMPAGGPDLGHLAAELADQQTVLAHGPGSLLVELFVSILRDFRDELESIEETMAEVEQSVFSDARSDPSRQIYELARRVVSIRRVASTMQVPLDRLSHGDAPGFDPVLRRWIGDVNHGVERLVGQLDAYNDALINALQAHLAKVGTRQNDDMRKISAWVAIAAVPTAVAGIYGMNFSQNMPLLHSEWGFITIMGLIAVGCAVLYARFRRSGWL